MVREMQNRKKYASWAAKKILLEEMDFKLRFKGCKEGN